MNRSSLMSAVLVLSITLTACPFSSGVPVAEPDIPIDPQLLGLWIAGSADGQSVALLRFLALSECEYLVEAVEFPKEERGRHYRAYVVPIGDQRFIQFRELESSVEPPVWNLARLSLSGGGTLTLRLVDDAGIPKALSSDAPQLRAFIASHLDDGMLYGDEQPVEWSRPAASGDDTASRDTPEP